MTATAMLPTLDADACARAAQDRDARFDGVFVVAVRTTGVYCRPTCPGRPLARNVSYLPTPAAAQQAGFRACKRCHPDAAPASPAWAGRTDAVARALRLIDDGVVERVGVPALARRLGLAEAELERSMTAELGVGPAALAAARRSRTARALLEGSDLPEGEVAAAAGFGGPGTLDEACRRAFALTPAELRARARRPSTARAARDAPPGAAAGEPGDGWLSLRLPYRAPLPFDELLAFLGRRAVPGVEEVTGGTYARVLRLPGGLGVVRLAGGGGGGGGRRGDGAGDERRPGPWLDCRLRLDDPRDVGTALHRCRRLLDLDADPVAVDAALAADPALAPLVAACPGRRAPGHVDGDELAVRAVLGQQVSLAAARRLAGNVAARYGDPLPAPVGGLTVAFPAAEALAAADLAPIGMPGSRRRTLQALTRALAGGDLALDPGAEPEAVERDLLALPGIGPWTAAYIRMRGLSDPDVFPATDLGVRHALARLADAAGGPAGGGPPPDPDRWRPWRSYAVQHLWASLAGPDPGARAGEAT